MGGPRAAPSPTPAPVCGRGEPGLGVPGSDRCPWPCWILPGTMGHCSPALIYVSSLCFLRSPQRALAAGVPWAGPCWAPRDLGGSWHGLGIREPFVRVSYLVRGHPAQGLGQSKPFPSPILWRATWGAPGRRLTMLRLIGCLRHGRPPSNRIAAPSWGRAAPALLLAEINASQGTQGSCPWVSILPYPPGGEGVASVPPRGACPPSPHVSLLPLLSRFPFLTSIFTLPLGARLPKSEPRCLAPCPGTLQGSA